MATKLSQFVHRPPPSSPSLIALLELIPPSPILTPSDLSTSFTSGEIPILLFDSSDSSVPSLGKQYTFPSPRTWEFNLSRPTLLIPDHGLNGVPNAEPSEDHLPDDQAFDTFGRPTRKNLRHRLSLCWTSNTTAGGFIRDRGKCQLENQSQDSNPGQIPLCHEDPWMSASYWDQPLSPWTALSEEDRSEDRLSAFLEPEPICKAYPTKGERSSLQDPDPTLVDVASEIHNMVPLASSPTSNSVSSLPKQRSPSTTTQGTDLISFPESLHLAHNVIDYIDDSCSICEISSIEFRVGETSSIQGLSTLASTSSLARRPAIHRAFPSPKHRKEFHVSNLPGNTSSPRFQIPIVATKARQGETTEQTVE